MTPACRRIPSSARRSWRMSSGAPASHCTTRSPARRSPRRPRCRVGAGARRRYTSHEQMSEDRSVEPGPDGKPRCWWCLGTEDYLAYHDEEWGRPLHGEPELFERLTLEAFQSGLSWLTILRKRENFRRAFDGFEIERVAEYGPKDVERLLGDAGIVRNRRKIEAAIANAKADLEPTTTESKALAKELKQRGFVFVGPTTVYATMEAIGVVNDHLAGCAFRRVAD